MVNYRRTNQITGMHQLNIHRLVLLVAGLLLFCVTLQAAEPVANSIGLEQLDSSHEKILISALESIG